MSDLEGRIRRLTDAPPIDLDRIVATGKRPGPQSSEGHRRRQLVVAAAGVAIAMVAAVLVIALRPPSTSNVNVEGARASAPSGPAVSRHAADAGYEVTVTLPHSTYPAGSQATASVVVRLPRAQTFEHVCVDQVFQLDLESTSFQIQPSWSQAHCAGSVTVGTIGRFQVTAVVPKRVGAYLAVLRTQHLDGGGPEPLPVTVIPASGPLPESPLTMALHLVTTRAPAGEPIQGTVTFVNHTSAAIPVATCAADGWLEIGLTNPTAGTASPISPLIGCPPTVMLRPGVTHEKVVLGTRYGACGNGRGLQKCEPGPESPPLPLGRYTTTVELTGLPASTELPAPVTVTLLAAAPR